MIDPAELAGPGSEAQHLVSQLDLDRLPRHIAVIMDGNGRWARERRLPRVAGHRAGIDAVREIVEVCARMKLDVLTLYAFSKENWKRPRSEVTTLMTLLKEYVRRELKNLRDNDIKLRIIGRMEDLPSGPRQELLRALEQTRDNSGLQLNIALSYGGRSEIVDACRAIVEQRVDPADVDADLVASHLSTAGQPDPDLLIRTSGELRVSNFLLWQIAYAEIWVTDTLWPDFRRIQLFQALLDFQRRERRYGGLGETNDPAAVVRS